MTGDTSKLSYSVFPAGLSEVGGDIDSATVHMTDVDGPPVLTLPTRPSPTAKVARSVQLLLKEVEHSCVLSRSWREAIPSFAL